VKYGRKNFDPEFVALTLGQLDLPMHGVENFVLIADVAHDARPASFGGTVTPEHLLVVSKRRAYLSLSNSSSFSCNSF
jgi:hypothetical protein